MKAHVRKLAGGLLAPDTDMDMTVMNSLKTGTVISIEWTRPRNYRFHKKLFALLNLGFESWEPEEVTYKGQVVGKNFDKFRNDITVMAGHYEMAVNMRGEVQLTAKSISFSKMEQGDFEQLYSDVANVILAKILTKYSRDDLDNVVNQVLSFV